MWDSGTDPDLVAGMDELRKIKPRREKIARQIAVTPFYDLEDLKAITGMSRTKIYNMVNDGEMPAQKKLGKRSVRWVKADIDAWLKQIIES